jgi:hypothetical protein
MLIVQRESAVRRYRPVKNGRLEELRRRISREAGALDLLPELETLRSMTAFQIERLHEVLNEARSAAESPARRKPRRDDGGGKDRRPAPGPRGGAGADSPRPTPEQITAELRHLSLLLADVGRMSERVRRQRTSPTSDLGPIVYQMGQGVVDGVEAVVADGRTTAAY